MDDRDGGVVEEGGDRGVSSAAVPLGLTPAFLAFPESLKAKALQSVDMQRDQSTSPGDGLRGRDLTHRRPPRFQFSLRLGRHGDVCKDATTQDGEQKCRLQSAKREEQGVTNSRMGRLCGRPVYMDLCAFLYLGCSLPWGMMSAGRRRRTGWTRRISLRAGT